jgi:TolB-like protein/DNA-binding winged helix-turn-helix (wHTH) protein/Flp pilus assembly protein TadD
MKMTVARTALFGPYALDLRSGELRKFGTKVKMGEQAFQILRVLLETPGEMVTREDLRAKLWTSETFVDFDHGLNSAVQRLRDCLSDSAEKPRWIETVPRRGYRFIAPVTLVAEPPQEASPPPSLESESSEDGHRNPSSRRVIWAVASMVLLGSALVAWYLLRPHPATVMLAALPFENLSGDSEQEYFSDGLSDEMINQMGRLQPGRLRVIARTSSMLYKGTKKNIAEIGRELHADYILEGSVRQDGEKVRISARLIQVRDQSELWTHTFDRDLSHTLELQGEVAQAIANEINVRLAPAEQARLAKPRPVNPDAYRAYLKGRYYAAGFTSDGSAKATDYFQQAIAIDPKYALPYEGLAYNYILQSSWPMPPNQAMPKAREAAKKALELDDTLAGAHTSLAAVLLLYDWNRSAAEQELKRALEINPSYAPAHYTLSWVWGSMGRFDEAVSENVRAQELDPIALDANIYSGITLYYARRYDQAIRQMQNTLEINPGNWAAHFVLGHVYQHTGRFSEALTQFQEARQQENHYPAITASLGLAYALSEKQGEARKILAALEAQSKAEYVPADNMALVCLGLGDRDGAFAWLEKAYAQRSPFLVWLKVDPDLESVRSDRRFEDLVRRVGMAE